mgnify:CR=1 FL=1
MFMLSSYSNNVIAAKARGMYGKRITIEQYEELLRCRSVSEAASYLKNQTHFRYALENVNPANIHRRQLENMLTREAFAGLPDFPGQCGFDGCRKSQNL